MNSSNTWSSVKVSTALERDRALAGLPWESLAAQDEDDQTTIVDPEIPQAAPIP